MAGEDERRRRRILFLIRSLNRGGAERQLFELARRAVAEFEIRVLTFYPGGAFWERLSEQSIPCLSLAKKGRWDLARPASRLAMAVRTWHPDLIQSYLPEANLAALFARLFLPATRVVWGVRASDMDYARYDLFSRLMFRFAALASWKADLVVANSHGGAKYHLSKGYADARVTVIPNGIDTTVFRPDSEMRKAFRNHLGMASDQPLVGIAGRLDPMKDHATFLHSCRNILHRRADVRFVCAGTGTADYRRGLMALSSQLGMAEAVTWLGELADMRPFYNGLDVLCSSSAFGEGFPNVVGEAMACGTPCVVTDVGDSALVVGETGRVVRRRDAGALAAAVLELLGLGAAGSFRHAARARIVEEFGVERMTARTMQAYRALLTDRKTG